MEDKLLMTYALLAHLKETYTSHTGSLIQIFEPVVKKVIIEYSKEKGSLTIMGKSLTELQDKAKKFFGLDIPLGVLTIIMDQIRKEINDENVFAFHKEGSFIIKAFAFTELDQEIEKEQTNIEILQDDYEMYCTTYNYEYKFKELQDFILASKMDLFTSESSEIHKMDFSIPKYITLKVRDKKIFKIISDIYLGSLISTYLELRIENPVTKTELLIDTNFYTSLINLGTEESYITCNQLFTLCKRLGFKFSILYSTVDQIKILLGSRITDFAHIDIGYIKDYDVFGACLRRRIDKTQLERIKDKVDSTISGFGIEVIGEARLGKFIDEAKKSKKYQELRVIRGNNTSALNDCVAHYYVLNNRGQHVREFSSVKCWFLNNSHHTSYEAYHGYKIHERTDICANELLTLLWLTNPNQKDVSSEVITKGGLTTYVSKYRNVKMPSTEIIKLIKEKANIALQNGKILEKDIYSIGIRMTEGHFDNGEIESLTKMDEDKFATIIKEYSNQDNEIINRLNSQTQEIEVLNATIERVAKDNDKLLKDNQDIKYGIAIKEYEKTRDIKINKEIEIRSRKMANTAWIYIFFFIILSSLWLIDKYFSKIINPILGFIIAFGVMIGSLFLIKFVDHKTVLQCLNYTFRKSFRIKVDEALKHEIVIEYEKVLYKPKMEDFLN